MFPVCVALILGLLPAQSRATNCDGMDAACGSDGGGARDLRADSRAQEDTRLQGGGISCTISGPGAGHGQRTRTGHAPLWLAGLLLASLWLVRRRRAMLLSAAAVALLLCGPARAQSVIPQVPPQPIAIDAIHFRPTLTPGGILNVEGSAPQPHLTGAGGFLLSYGNEPLILVDRTTGLQGATGRAGVQGQLLGSVGISLGLFNFLALGFDLPMVLWQNLGDLDVQDQLRAGTGQATPTSSAPGDLRFFAKLQLRDNRQGGLGVALMPFMTVPTGDANSYAGWGVFTGEIRLVLDYRFDNGVLLALNASFFSHEETMAKNLRLSHELRYGIGVLSPLTETLGVFLEVFGSIGLEGEDGGVQVTTANSPAEGLFGLRWRHSSGIGLQVGAGMGLNAGYGAPSSRVFAGFSYTPVLDLLTGRKHPEVQQPAPPKATVTIAQEAPPPAPAAPVPPPSETQQPAPAQQEAPVPPVTQAPPVQVSQAPKPAPAPANEGELAWVQGWRVMLAEPVSFTPGRSVMTERGEAVARAVAQVLRQHPEVHHVLIEGHVDDPLLSSARAQGLSRDRAEAVARAVAQQGVAQKRIQVRGYGNSRPLDERPLPDARERNSRIEFLILD